MFWIFGGVDGFFVVLLGCGVGVIGLNGVLLGVWICVGYCLGSCLWVDFVVLVCSFVMLCLGVDIVGGDVVVVLLIRWVRCLCGVV